MRRSTTTLAGICAAIFFCLNSVQGQQVAIEDFDEVQLFKLRNTSGMAVDVTNYGAIVTSIVTPDRDGKFADIALGYDQLADYTNAVNKPYFGAIVGRYGNRIANGEFTLDGETYSLATNNGPNHLHGGVVGFDKVIWDSQVISGPDWCGVELSYLSKDMEEGYPGNLQCKVTYKLTNDNELSVDYLAKTDKATPINLTQHTYFNLKGEGEGDVLEHELMINAFRYTPVDATSIPTGELATVEGTPFDFRTAKPMGQDIEQDHEQIKFGNGFDHNWVIDREEGTSGMVLAAQVHEPSTGRTMEVRTTEPGVQFYCGNFLDGRLIGKAGKKYIKRGGFCLETQHYPDSPNRENFPSSILRPDEEYKTSTVFKFSTK